MIIRAFLIGALKGLATGAAVVCILGLAVGIVEFFKWCKAYWNGKFNYTDDEKDFFGK